MSSDISNSAEFTQAISSINELENFGIMYVNSEEKSKICREPTVTIPGKSSENVPWVVIKEKKDSSEYSDGIIKAVLSARGLGCVAVGGAAVSSAASGGIASIAIGSLAGASLIAATHQCSVYLTQVGQAVSGNSKDIELYDNSMFAKTTDRAAAVIDSLNVAKSAMSAGAKAFGSGMNSLRNIGRAATTGEGVTKYGMNAISNLNSKMEFELAVWVATGTKSPAKAMKAFLVITQDKTGLLGQVYNVIEKYHEVTDAASKVSEQFEVIFALTEKKN